MRPSERQVFGSKPGVGEAIGGGNGDGSGVGDGYGVRQRSVAAFYRVGLTSMGDGAASGWGDRRGAGRGAGVSPGGGRGDGSDHE